MIALLVVALVAGAILYAFIMAKSPQQGKRSGRSKGRSYTSSPQLGDVRERWSVIMATSAGGAAGLKNAISEADKLFDGVMRAQGLPGDTMADRLKAAKPRFSNYGIYDGIWRAHKLRNALAHEVSFDLVPSQTREALSDFERGLRDLKAL
ncbi:hypothetical protein HJC99_03540 [Candidatus Saccharibacteria bacterium]|nr:hypothetical protein [Candidatus Saccharibacteria bacterium]